MSGFTFRGIHSSKFGICTQDQSRVLIPPRREGRVTIPGRSGYYDGILNTVYDERVEEVVCGFVKPAGMTIPEACREIAYWLSGTGRLVYDKEPDKSYTATLSGAPPMEQHLHYGRFTLTWSCNPPFAYGRRVALPIRTGRNVVRYQGTAETPCIILLQNNSSWNIQNLRITAVKRSRK